MQLILILTDFPFVLHLHSNIFNMAWSKFLDGGFSSQLSKINSIPHS